MARLPEGNPQASDVSVTKTRAERSLSQTEGLRFNHRAHRGRETSSTLDQLTVRSGQQTAGTGHEAGAFKVCVREEIKEKG